MRKITVAHDLPERQPRKTILYAKHIAASMQGNPYFPSPNVPMATFLAHIEALEAAEIAAMTRARGAADARDRELERVENDIRQLRTYIELVANTFADRNEGKAVVVSSGMRVKNSAGPRKQPFSAKPGPFSGSVRLDARRPKGSAAFYWQHSTDGETWVDADDTPEAHIVLTGLTPGVTYSFRFRVLGRGGKTDWSDSFRLMVV